MFTEGILSIAGTYRQRIEEDRALALLRRPQAPFYIALLETLFANGLLERIESSRLVPMIEDVMEDLPEEAVSAYFRGGTPKDAASVARDLYGHAEKSKFEWLVAEHDDGEKADYYRVTEAALEAREYLRASHARNAFNNTTTETLSDTLELTLARMTGTESERDYLEKKVAELQSRLENMPEQNDVERLKSARDGLAASLQLARGLPASVRDMTKTMRLDAKSMLEAVQSGKDTPIEARNREESSWRAKFEGTKFTEAVGSDMDRFEGKDPLSRIEGIIETDPSYATLKSDLIPLIEVQEDLRSALNDWTRALGERNDARDAAARISFNSEYRHAVYKAKRDLEAFSFYVENIHKGGNTELRSFSELDLYPICKSPITGFCHEDGLKGLEKPPSGKHEPAREATPEEKAKILERVRRLGAPKASRAARTALANAVKNQDGTVNLPKSFAAAGLDALCQDIVPMMVNFGKYPGEDGYEEAVWIATDAVGRAYRFKGTNASATETELKKIAGLKERK